MSRKKVSKNNKWIQSAHLKKGALRNYIKRKFGKEGFTKQGTIKVSILRQLAKDPNVTEKTRKRAKTALTLRKLRKEKEAKPTQQYESYDIARYKYLDTEKLKKELKQNKELLKEFRKDKSHARKLATKIVQEKIQAIQKQLQLKNRK